MPEPPNDADLSDVSDGLLGELYGDDGWIKALSTQRTIDLDMEGSIA